MRDPVGGDAHRVAGTRRAPDADTCRRRGFDYRRRAADAQTPGAKESCGRQRAVGSGISRDAVNRFFNHEGDEEMMNDE